MEKKELYDGFLSLEKHAQQMLREIAAMKDDMAETLERNAELEIENKHLRQHLAELEKDDNKTSDGGVELSKSKQNLESLYNEGFHVCPMFYGQRRVNDEPCAFCTEIIYGEN